jgi:LysM repeat protein
MKNDPELQINDAWSDDSTYSPKRRRIGSDNSKPLRILLGILLILIFGLEKQLAELQGKIGTSGPDPALLQRVDALAQKVEALEKQKQPTAESKAKPSPSSKPAVSTEKQYHTVKKGEALYRISKKYGISVEELRKLNNLSADQPLRTGEKLLVSPGR